MKLHHAFCAFLLLLGLGHVAVELHAARGAGAVPLDKPQMQSLTAVPLFDAAGKLLAMHVTVKYVVSTLQPDGITRQKSLFSADIDLVAQAKQQVIVNSEIMEFGDLSADLMTISEAVWNQRFPPPLPVLRRKALREP